MFNLRRVMTVASLVAVTAVAPAVAQASPALTEFNQPTGDAATQPVAGPDGEVWFLNGMNGVGAISPSGAFSQINFGSPMVNNFLSIAEGENSTLWVADMGAHAIWSIAPDRPAGEQATEYTTGLLPGASPQLLTLGPDGNIWFVDGVNKEIGRITPSGAITMFSGLDNTSSLDAMTVGPDGNIWFTDQGDGEVGYITMSGAITEIPVTGMPDDITAGPDGNIWFTDSDGIGEVNATTHVVTMHTSGLQSGAVPDAIIAGPDGNVWFDDQYSTDYAVGRITPAGVISEVPLGDGLPVDLTVGLDGDIWVAQGAGLNPALAPESVDRVTPAATLTAADVQRLSTGLHPDGIEDGDEIITGPDGNLWFTDSFAPKGIGKVSLQIPPTVTTGGASAVSSSSATIAGSVDTLGSSTTVAVQYGTSPALGASSATVTLPASGAAAPVSLGLTGLPAGATIYYRVVATSVGGSTGGATASFTTLPGAVVTTPPMRTIAVRIGDQHLTLRTPARSMCQAAATRYAVSLTASRLHSGAKLRFVSASFTLGRGVRHSRKVKRRVKVGGTIRTRTVTVITYTPNAVARRLPAKERLSLRGLSRGTHTLTVTVAYHETTTVTVRRDGRRTRVRRTITVTRTLRAPLQIC